MALLKYTLNRGDNYFTRDNCATPNLMGMANCTTKSKFFMKESSRMGCLTVGELLSNTQVSGGQAVMMDMASISNFRRKINQ